MRIIQFKKKFRKKFRKIFLIRKIFPLNHFDVLVKAKATTNSLTESNEHHGNILMWLRPQRCMDEIWFQLQNFNLKHWIQSIQSTLNSKFYSRLYNSITLGRVGTWLEPWNPLGFHLNVFEMKGNWIFACRNV